MGDEFVLLKEINKFFTTKSSKIPDELHQEIQNNQMNEDILKYLQNLYEINNEQRNKD